MDVKQIPVLISDPAGRQIPVPIFVWAYCLNCRMDRSHHVIYCHERFPGHQEYNKGVITAECRVCSIQNTLHRWKV